MTEFESPLTPEEIHAVLFEAWEQITALRGRCEFLISTDTAFALGLALGTIGQAKALVGRDIDQARKSAQ